MIKITIKLNYKEGEGEVKTKVMRKKPTNTEDAMTRCIMVGLEGIMANIAGLMGNELKVKRGEEKLGKGRVDNKCK